MLLSFSAKESNQRKLSAAPDSVKVSSKAEAVVAEPVNADFCVIEGVVRLFF